MFITIEEGLTEAEKLGKREQVLQRAKEIQQEHLRVNDMISLLHSIELAFIEITE